MATLAGLVGCLATVAHAQQAEDEKYIGVGGRVRPAYEGAEGNRGDVIPYLRLYGEQFFARTTQGILEGGWRTQAFGGVVIGAQLAYEEGRVTDDSAFLREHNFDDLDPSASLGLYAEGDWKVGRVPLNALLRYRHDVDSGNGAQTDLRLTAGILDWGRVRAGFYGQLTWSDDKSTQRYFRITPQQAATTGLPAYGAGSGWRSAQMGVIGDVDFSRHWVAVGSFPGTAAGRCKGFPDHPRSLELLRECRRRLSFLASTLNYQHLKLSAGPSRDRNGDVFPMPE